MLSAATTGFQLRRRHRAGGAFAVASHEARVLGVDRGDFLAAAVHWLDAKRQFESRRSLARRGVRDSELKARHPQPRAPSPEPASAATPEMPVIDRFRFRMADARAKTDLAWTTEPTIGSEARGPREKAWKDASYGFWDEMGFEPTGIGLYRGLLDVPAAWKGKHVLLALAAWNLTVFSGTSTVYVNGKLVGPGCSGGDVPNTVLDVTALVHQGRNDLGILVEAGPTPRRFPGHLSHLRPGGFARGPGAQAAAGNCIRTTRSSPPSPCP